MKEEFDRLYERLSALESASAVSACMHEYMRLCDQLDVGFDLEPLMFLFTTDAVWEGKGGRYAKSFGRRVGREAIRQMFDKYVQPPAHFALNAHFLTSEKITVTSPTEARGTWMLLQTSSFNDGRSQLSAALLDVLFQRVGEQWKIAHFTTESRFNRPVDTAWDCPQALPVPAEDE
ncbi:nuclear transport factor 2 family protein [Amphritea opalescens]|uniref:Nuclear transport factor 2 family protein n=1 Tax=Amphritea opalescens TaxID=2490544 RepID=A0A430KLZ6_9GAMM|nr:nuclear transport factor 2 family protein [Amphritea opalescens]RTE64501.1 nuclear transport factor 2 family protein [Amphritea opalescens]